MKSKLSAHTGGDVDFLIPASKQRQRHLLRHQICRLFSAALCLLIAAAFLSAASVYFWMLHSGRQTELAVEVVTDDVYSSASPHGVPTSRGPGNQSWWCPTRRANATSLCVPSRPALSNEECFAYGCCLSALADGRVLCYSNEDSPSPAKASGGYVITEVTPTSVGFSATLSQKAPSPWPKSIAVLKLDVIFEDQPRLRFKIYDPAHQRYEVPLPPHFVSTKALSTDYKVDIAKVGEDFHLVVTRASTGAILFDNFDSVLVFADQFIQINTTLGSAYIYGLGEHRGRLLHNTSQPLAYTFWSRDIEPQVGCNLYGNHPFLVAVENDGSSHGVLLLNSNAMEVDIIPGSPPQLSYTTIGGILDFYIFTGPSPDTVVQQYTNIIGRPYMPPYWALGFHLSRWGYGSADNLSLVIQRNRAFGFPYDTQWSDIDYMDGYRDWTYDKIKYSTLPAIVEDLHANGQHYVIIVDAAISNSSGYVPFEQGMIDKVFVMDSNGSLPIYGSVWPGTTVFPDFWNPNTTTWWTNLAQSFHNEIPYDGLWIDMNEPSNFGVGSLSGCPGGSTLDTPPFTPPVCGQSLLVKTICPSSLHHIGTHYDLHSLYGLSMSVATETALRSVIKGKRSLVLSRSTFVSSGKYAAHWLGDNDSQWSDLAFSIAGILNFNFFGIPFVGADVCGFEGDTTEELCVRWMQLGAFYPFMRNHNSLGQKDQDPGADWFSLDAKVAMKAALEQRYYLLPHLYTLLAFSRINGTAVARPLFFQYPTDVNALANDRQFLWGDSILVAPVVDEGAQDISIYLPKDLWYDFATGSLVRGNGTAITVAVTMSSIPVFQRGGTIIPVQAPNVTTSRSRVNPFSLLIALDESGGAVGRLYWDDGETLDAIEKGLSNYFTFNVSKNTLTSDVVYVGYETRMSLASVIIRGLSKVPTSAKVNGVPVQVSNGKQGVVLEAKDVSLLKPIVATWE